MSQDQILCVTYFDQVIGPNTLYCSESLEDIVGAPDLDKILEFNDEEGTFIFAYRKYQTVNHIFYIDSKLARGGRDLLMITYMIKTAIFQDEIVDVFKYLDSKSPILEDFAEEIKNLKEISSLLHMQTRMSSDRGVLNFAEDELKTDFLDIFNGFFQKLMPEYRLETPARSKKAIKKIFILGAPKAGKKTLLKNIELMQFLNIKNNDLPSRILEVLVENLEILIFDENKCEFDCKGFDSFEDCMIQSQGFILIFKTSDENSILETKNLFQVIEDKQIEMKNEPVPVLIVGNKFDVREDEKKDFIHKTFQIEELKKNGRRIRYFPIKILEEDQRVMKALRWMIKNIL
ncbi:MAG: ADP-ribosylation factor-like protein [Promethearchaeota archaeon]|jgi:signal recognition particle receptor subunit beta